MMQAGTFVNLATSECVECPPGHYAPTAVNDGCVVCDAGSATTLPRAATKCEACNPGEWSLENSTNCSLCAVGRYSRTRASVCVLCDPGTASAAVGSESCLACDSGSFAASLGASACDLCGNGTFSGVRAASCTPCEPGYHQDAKGATACKVRARHHNPQRSFFRSNQTAAKTWLTNN